MIFNWLKTRKHQEPDHDLEYEYSENPVYDYETEHRETMELCEDILTKLDEIKVLIDEMKKEEK